MQLHRASVSDHGIYEGQNVNFRTIWRNLAYATNDFGMHWADLYQIVTMWAIDYRHLTQDLLL